MKCAPVGPLSSKALLASALLAAALACGPAEPTNERGRRLTADQMAETKGGVAVTVVKPTPGKEHFIDNPPFVANVHNSLGQSQTTLYLHHGSTKTGLRTLATPAPGYSGDIETRFKHLGGSGDLVVKYHDPHTGRLRVAATVPNQRMGSGVKLHRVIFHNVTSIDEVTSADVVTNVAGSVVARIVDSQTYDPNASVPNSIDGILAQCRRRRPSRRTQFQLAGLDNGISLNRIHAPHCANLDVHLDFDNQADAVVYDAVSEACMQELLLGAAAADIGQNSMHVFIVKRLPPGWNGVSTSTAGGALIPEAKFADTTWQLPRLVAHELIHGFGVGHRHNQPSGLANEDCMATIPQTDRALMCPKNGGTLLSDQECVRIYDANPHLTDYN